MLCAVLFGLLVIQSTGRIGTFLGNTAVFICANTWWHQHNMLDKTAILSECGHWPNAGLINFDRHWVDVPRLLADPSCLYVLIREAGRFTDSLSQ